MNTSRGMKPMTKVVKRAQADTRMDLHREGEERRERP